MAGVALCDICTCPIKCQKLFCVKGAIPLLGFQKMTCSFRRRRTLETSMGVLRGRHSPFWTRRVACFLRIALAALRQVVTTLQSWAGGALVDPRRGPVEPKEAKQQFRDFRRPGIWTALIITTPPDVTPEIDLHPEVKILSCGQYSFPCCSWKGRKKAW